MPEYDEERVYVSDIKKVFQWYNLLHKHQLLEVIEKEAEQAEQADQAEQAEQPGEAKDGDAKSEEKST